MSEPTESRTKAEILKENTELLSHIDAQSAKYQTYFRDNPEGLAKIKEIIGSVLDWNECWDFDPDKGESDEHACELLGIPYGSDIGGESGALLVNMRLKRCIHELEDFIDTHQS